MTNPADQTPTTTGSATPADDAGSTRHWSRGALSGAGKLISTAANDDLVRNMISSRARSNAASMMFGGTILGAIAARVATRSVPGALLVGGALVAKAVYDRRKAKAEAKLPPKA